MLSKVRVKDLGGHRMAQRTHHGSGHVSDLFLRATKSLLAVKLHKESVLREGKPLTTDFQFLKNVKTQQLLRRSPLPSLKGTRFSLRSMAITKNSRQGEALRLLTACGQMQPASFCNFTPKHMTALLLPHQIATPVKPANSHSPEITLLQQSVV